MGNCRDIPDVVLTTTLDSSLAAEIRLSCEAALFASESWNRLSSVSSSRQQATYRQRCYLRKLATVTSFAIFPGTPEIRT
jgi:hypothetical protein